MRSSISRLALLMGVTLIAAPAFGEGIVLMKNGDRITGEITVLEDEIRIENPNGLTGSQTIQKSVARYWNTEDTKIPQEFLKEGEEEEEDRERDLWQEEYRKIEQEMKTVIGITRKKLAREIKKEDELLRKLEYRNDDLCFRVRPPLGWRTSVQGELVMFVGPTRRDVEPRIHVLSMRVPGTTFEEIIRRYKDRMKEHHGESVASGRLATDIMKGVDQKQWGSSYTVDRGGIKIRTRRFLVHKKDRIFLLVLYTDEREDEQNHEIFSTWKSTFVILI